MTFTIPESTKQYGFITSGMGAHTGRTIMFRDLYALLGVGSSESSLEDYRNSILTENVLLKPTESARNEAFRRLKQLYGLDQRLTVFRSLRMLWDQDPKAQPMLALLCAVARDPLLRVTVDAVINMQPDTTVTSLFFWTNHPREISRPTVSKNNGKCRTEYCIFLDSIGTFNR